MADVDAQARLLSLVRRAVLFAGIWVLLTEGDPGSWVLGVPAILGAIYVSRRLDAVTGLRPVALVRFFPMFVWRSLVGATDVALRALRPDRPMSPEFADYQTSLPEGLPRVFFANTVSLLPGTLSADLEGNTLRIHLLDNRDAAMRSLATLEATVATMFKKGRNR